MTLHRQAGAQRVGMKGARGHARPGNAADGSSTADTRRRATKTTGGLERDASTNSKGKSRQAKKDSC